MLSRFDAENPRHDRLEPRLLCKGTGPTSLRELRSVSSPSTYLLLALPPRMIICESSPLLLRPITLAASPLPISRLTWPRLRLILISSLWLRIDDCIERFVRLSELWRDPESLPLRVDFAVAARMALVMNDGSFESPLTAV